ncbi:MAG: winged helix-turn-helix transcriptional regulator [Actinobacteria bacterium]|nr:winged helix-turn-helix transcriptional regulator [Actinomycetota bacterium]
MRAKAAPEPAGLVDAVQAVARQLVGLTAIALASVEHQRGIRVTVPEYRTLVLLATHGERIASELAADLGVTRPAVTRIVSSLASGGLVSRRRMEADRRQFRVTLTHAGRQVVDSATGERERQLRTALGALSPAQRRGLLRALTQFHGALAGPSIDSGRVS